MHMRLFDMEKVFGTEQAPNYYEMSSIVYNNDLLPCSLNTVSFDANRDSKPNQIGVYPFGCFPLITNRPALSKSPHKSDDSHVDNYNYAGTTPLVGTHLTYSDEKHGVNVYSSLFSERALLSKSHLPSVQYRLPSSWCFSRRLLQLLEERTQKATPATLSQNLLQNPSSYQDYVEVHGSTARVAYRVTHPYFQYRTQVSLTDLFSSSGNATIRLTPHLVLGSSWEYEPFRSGLTHCRIAAHYPLKNLFPSCPHFQKRDGNALAEVDFRKGCSVQFRVPLSLAAPYFKKDTSDGLLVLGTHRVLLGLHTATTRFVDQVLCYANIASQSSLSVVVSKEVSKEVNVQLFSQWKGWSQGGGNKESSLKGYSCAFLCPSVGIRFTSSAAPSGLSFPSLNG